MEIDSIKWPSEFPELQRIDSALKCGICYDYMKTSMVTPCSHTYCSLCIRKYLQYCDKCPACFVECHENGLRNSRPLDAVVSNFMEVRDKLLRAVRVAEAASQKPPVDSNSQLSSPQPAVTPKSTLKAFMTPPSTKSTAKARNCLFGTAVSPQCKVPQMFTKPSPVSSKRAEETAPCPVCQVDIPARNINLHLDACLSRSASRPKAEPVRRKRDPLPKRLYHLMSDKVLKKVLKDYGLSVQGDRKAWLTRLRRYIVLYNSETDVDNPRPVSDILHQVEREEREEAKKNINPLFKRLSQMVDRNSNEKEIDTANKKYLEDQKSNFEKLIEEMKKRNGNKVKKPKPIVESDEETNDAQDAPSTSAQAGEDIYEQDTIELSDCEDPDYVPDGVITGPGEAAADLDSSQDSVFDTMTKSASAVRTSTPSRKRFVKVTTPKCAPSPDVFNCPSPTDDIYQSIFGNDEVEGPTEKAEEVEAAFSEDELFADENEAPTDNISINYGEDDDMLRAVDGEDDRRETPKPPSHTRAKRKQQPITDEDGEQPVRRSKRTSKKRKSSSS